MRKSFNCLFHKIKVIRKPLKGDEVKLSNKSILELKGLQQNQIGKVISIDKNDLNYYYCVQLPSSHYTSWFNINEVELNDPNSPIPKPQPPQNNQCCGSECPDCVWIQYWEELQEWEKEFKE